MTYEGQCHCGRLKLAFESDKSIAELGARGCTCSYCQKNGGVWTSDPSGQVILSDVKFISKYQFGTKTADFITCSNCHTLVLAIDMNSGSELAVINTRCLDAAEDFLAIRSDNELGLEGTGDRLARRQANWTPCKLIQGQEQ